MAVSQQTPLQAYTASGASAVFAFSFQLLAAADMTVLVDGVPQALGADFSVTTGPGPGGSVTMVVRPTAGRRVVLLRNSSVTRSTDYQNNGDLLAAVINADFDRLWLVLQELVFGSKSSPSSVRAPAGEVLSQLPPAAERAFRIPAFDSAGNLIVIPGVDSGSASALALDLLDNTGSTKGPNLIGFRAGLGYQIGVGKRLRQEVHITDAPFNAALDGSTDDTAAINAAAAYVKSIAPAVLVMDSGVAYCSDTLALDVGHGSTIVWHTRVRSAVSNKSAVRIGSTTGPTFNVHVIGSGAYVHRTSIDIAGTSVGLEISGLVWSNVKVDFASWFNIGMLVNGLHVVSYSAFHLGHLQDNRYNLFLTASGGGYCNENIFYGGAFNYTSDWFLTAGSYATTYNIYEDHWPTSPLNSNKFFGPCLETGGPATVGALIHGQNTHIYSPRLESGSGPFTDYKIIFAAPSLSCLLVGGVGVERANITDLGTANRYICLDGELVQNKAGAGQYIHAVGSPGATSTTRGYQVFDTSGLEAASMWTSGHILGRRLALRDATVAYSASMTPDSSLGQRQIITATSGTAFTINAPSNPPSAAPFGQRMTVTIRNTSGGALGAAIWNAIYRMSAWANPANGFSRSIDFTFDGSNWIEVSRTPADIPN